MKHSLTISLIVAALTIPMISNAKVDSNGLTGSEVKAQVVQANKDGAHTSPPAAQEYGTMPLNYSQSGSRIKEGSDGRLFAHH